MANPNRVLQAQLISGQTALDGGQSVTQLALFKEDGSPYTGDGAGLDAAGARAAIASKTQIVAVTATAAPNAVAAAGANPTKAEYDAVVTLVNELKADYNALLAALKA